MKTKVFVQDTFGLEQVNATIYKLREIKHAYNIVYDGKWLIKRY